MLTVLVATRNGAKTWPLVLEAYLKLETPANGWKLVIVDNGSTDQTSTIVNSFRDRLPLTYVYEPQDGKNTALNTGLGFVAGDLIVFSDDDAIPRSDWLVQLRRAADLHPRCDIFGGRIVPRWETHPPDWILNTVPLAPVFAISDPQLVEGPAQSNQIFGPNMAVRSQLFAAGHRFDPAIGPRRSKSYPMGSESELVRRLMKAGHAAWHAHAAVVEHFIRTPQLRPSWILGRAQRYGRGQYRLSGRNATATGPRLFGAPATAILKLARTLGWSAKALFRRDSASLFRSRWERNFLWGQVVEARLMARMDPAAPSGPVFPRVGVIALVPDDWGPHWESRHHLLSRLAPYFNVAWCDPSHGWRAIWRSRRKRPINPEPPRGLHVCRQELWLPRFYRTPWLDKRVRAARLSRIRKRLASLGCTKIVLYIWRPQFLSALGDVATDLVVFHIDDEYSSLEGTIVADEATLIEKADQVIVHSHPLMRSKGGINPHTALVPNGVDYARYAAPCAEPADLAGVPRPRIGYAGHLKRQLNWKLIGELVRAHPEWSFVFVGGFRPHSEVKDIVQDLSSFANVYFLGAKSVYELARYAQHFDCCVMPYDTAVYTNHYIYPMKLHEYLASGRPAVGTPIAVLKEFSDVVALAATVDEWSAAIRHSLSNEANAPEKRRQRQELARQHDWNILALRVAEILAERLGEPIPPAMISPAVRLAQRALA